MQTVLITGAASGIGRGAAHLFARAGWRCVLVDRNAQALSELGQHLPCAAAPHVLRAIDLTEPDQIAALRDDAVPLDAVLNNAGMSDTSNTPLDSQAAEQIERLLALNLAAPAAVVDACAERLRPGARIVNVASGAGLHAIPWRGAYSPSKAGLIAQTQALALARPDWCVTVLAPGFVRTELVESLVQTGRLNPERAVAKIPLGRMAQPDEMAHALHFLASPGARPLHGQVVAVNGGSSVYGGSLAFAPATLDPLPMELPLRLEIRGSDAAPWQPVAPTPGPGPHYEACLDLSAWHCAPGGLLRAVHAAAARFAACHAQQASLTLLLPHDRPGPWQTAGDGAAARMMVATLACEWGGRALRINALHTPAVPDARPLHPLLRFLCGPAAQYITGQTFVCQAAAPVEAA